MKIKIVELGKRDIIEIIELCNLIDRTLIGQCNYYEWYSWLNKGAKVWGIRENNLLVAVGSLAFYNSATDMVDYPEASVAVLTSGQVHPDYRGRGYQIALIKTRIYFSLKNRIYNIQCLVRSANNIAIKNLSKTGFVNKGWYKNEIEPTIVFLYISNVLILAYKIRNYLFFKLNKRLTR